MRRSLHFATGQEYLAETIGPEMGAAPQGEWRCPNPACGEPVTHVAATARHRAYFKHMIGVADLESCFYFGELEPTQRQHDCVDLLEGELIRRYGPENVKPEAWVDGVSYPLDLLVSRPDGERWGFWYVSPRRIAMTVNLLKQATAASIHVSIFTHVDAGKPSELFQARNQQAFLLDPARGDLIRTIDHQEVRAPLEHWQFDENGLLMPPAKPAPPPAPTINVPRPAEGGAPAQATFLMDPEPAAASTDQPAHGGAVDRLPPQARGRVVWSKIDRERLPADLAWIVAAPAEEWAPHLLQSFLSRKYPFRISQSCQFVGQRWRLHASLQGAHDVAFLRSMHDFWELLAEMGYVEIKEHPHPMEVRPVRSSNTP